MTLCLQGQNYADQALYVYLHNFSNLNRSPSCSLHITNIHIKVWSLLGLLLLLVQFLLLELQDKECTPFHKAVIPKLCVSPGSCKNLAKTLMFRIIALTLWG